MAIKTGYDCGIQRLALFSLAFAFLLVVSGPKNAYSQSVNWGPSVTSMGFGGSNRLGGVPPSVTSLGFGTRGASGSPHFHGPDFQGPNFDYPMFSQSQAAGRRRHDYEPIYPVWSGYYYTYPIISSSDDYQTSQDSPDNAENPDEYRGGPTIFDRRGDGQYANRRAAEPPQAVEEQPLSTSSAPQVAVQPQTVLVFKDGHKANVDNYAIVGSTLFDFTGGLRHKIALADLNLTATAQQNDDRGVDFELPAGSPSN